MDKQGERELFHRLRVRLTAVCALATGLILLGMTLAALAVSQNQLAARGTAAFQGEVNATLYHLRSQQVVEQSWLAQMEAGGNLLLYLELSGEPLLYGNGAERQRIVEMAREIALQEYGFDLGAAPFSRYQAEQQDFLFRDGTGQHWRAAALRLPQGKGWVGILALRSMAEEERELGLQRLAFGGFAVVAIGLLTAFAWQFTRHALKPIEESRRRQSAFVAAASHELRSPLAVVRACLSNLKDASPEKAEHFTKMAEGECQHMSRLVGDMLALASADGGSWPINPTLVEPETLLLEVAERFEAAAREKGIQLQGELPPEPMPRCFWDGQRVTQLLAVLVDNALSYTPQGGRVRLSVERAGERIHLRVADSGPGIPDGEKERVFERFYRADSARTGREHYGLGLSIAREIARLHHGTLEVADNPGGGALFTADLPIQ